MSYKMATGASMLYLKSLSLSKFKSFKSADLLFSKGFTCIVGPNGSGKSNICDALLFSLGESSLRRMRVDKLDLLINGGQKSKPGNLAKTHVKADFDGDQKLEVIRYARADGKSKFVVNGKTMTRHEVLEVLSSHKVHIDETNTITQGEILKMMDLNPKERRELIDIASGITEFENKKKESLRELEKVNIKTNEVQAILNERLGYIQELEKEKEAAENFTSMTTRLKLLKYNILVAKEQEIKQSYEKHSKEMSLLDSKKQKILSQLDELTNSVTKLTIERQQLTKELSESSTSMGEENKKLENISKELALLDANMQNNEKSILEKSSETSTMREEVAQIDKVVATNKSELTVYQKRIAELEPFFNDLKDEKNSETNENKAANLNVQIGNLEREFSLIQETISALHADLSMTKNSVMETTSRKENFDSHSKEKLAIKKEISERLDEAGRIAKKHENEILKNENRLRELTDEIGEIDTKSLSLKEQRAMSGSRESALNDRLASNFKEKDGFYGRVSQLCTYPTEYSMAIEASAGGRFEYFVVESIESASKIISYLKKNDLGRATFIPIKDLAFDRDKKKEQNLTAIIEMLKFDSKFGKVFEYVFNNTYLIDKVEDAKSAGVGRHRYVTLAGELVEQSGVLSGGSARRRVSIASIENQIKELASSKEKLLIESKTLTDSTMKARKEKALKDMELATNEAHLSDIDEQLREISEETKKSESALKSYESKIKELTAQITKSSEKNEQITSQLELARKEATDLYNKSIEAAKAKNAMSKAEKEKLNKMRTEYQELVAKNASATTEVQMSEKRKTDIQNALENATKTIADLKYDNKEKTSRKSLLEKGRGELEEKIKNNSVSSKKTYEKLKEMDNTLSKLTGEKGKVGAENDSIERQLNEINVKRSNFGVRLADIQAELTAYSQQNLQTLKMGIEEMEKEATYNTIKIEQLGNVNLKAPELYVQKKKDAEEASGRLETLVVEKDAILKMIEEIDSKKMKIFMETFEIVNTNFTKLYNYIFPGKASIELEDPKNPFESGLHIKMIDAKTVKRENSLSGGEKSLVMLMLVFSIHMHKPSSLYIFDEVDSALDKENSKKLSSLIKQMSQGSQFIVVSHNDSLIVNADTAIGVSKTEGESKAVGLQVANVAASPNVKGA